MLRIFTKPGKRVSLHSAGTGKVLLAYQQPRVVQTITEKTGLEPVTANTITAPDVLPKVLLRVRSQGYAIDMKEQEEGVCCLAAPVFTPDGQILAAMSISGPTNRLTRGRLAELVPHVKSVADALSRTINSVDATSTWLSIASPPASVPARTGSDLSFPLCEISIYRSKRRH